MLAPPSFVDKAPNGPVTQCCMKLLEVGTGMMGPACVGMCVPVKECGDQFGLFALEMESFAVCDMKIIGV